MSELSGRDLEIAVAKALGWTPNKGWYGGGQREGWEVGLHRTGLSLPWWETEEAAWQAQTPRYLTDPTAFSTVLAALDSVWWRQTHHPLFGDTVIIGAPMIAKVDGATYQEAVCRAFVAWKAAA